MTDSGKIDPHNGGAASPSKWGKGKTDPSSHWKPGCPSPNPKGRPKKSKNQKTLYQEAMNQKVTLTLKGGKKQTLTKKEMGYYQLANKSASGDMRAIAKQLELDQQFDPPPSTPPSAAQHEQHLKALDHYIALRTQFPLLAEKGGVDE